MSISPNQNKTKTGAYRLAKIPWTISFCRQPYEQLIANNKMSPYDEQPSIPPLGFHFSDQRSFFNMSTAHQLLIYFGTNIRAEIYLGA